MSGKIRKPQYEHVACVYIYVYICIDIYICIYLYTYIIYIYIIIILCSIDPVPRVVEPRTCWSELFLGFGESESNLEPCDLLIGFVGLDGPNKYTKNTPVTKK